MHVTRSNMSLPEESLKKLEGKTAMTRSWILTQYEELRKIAKFLGDEKIENDRPKADDDHSCPIEVGTAHEEQNCKTYRKTFVFSVGEQQYYFDK